MPYDLCLGPGFKPNLQAALQKLEAPAHGRFESRMSIEPIRNRGEFR